LAKQLQFVVDKQIESIDGVLGPHWTPARRRLCALWGFIKITNLKKIRVACTDSASRVDSY